MKLGDLIKVPSGRFTHFYRSIHAFPVAGRINDDTLILVLDESSGSIRNVALSDGRVGYVNIIGLEVVG